MLEWNNAGAFKRITVFRDTVVHMFPKQHGDLLEQFINYHVPNDKYDNMAFFDGSVMMDRTKGELSARCDAEEKNLLALNLANDVATGAKTTQEARDFYTQSIMNFIAGDTTPYMQSLQFTPPSSGADADTSTIN